jgi:L-alanine-DL-glutamate epimerase-like enolase superfamily enzyme
MKINAIRAYPIWVGMRDQLVVKVETDQGIFGWGGSGLSGRKRAVIGAIEHFAEFRRRPRRNADRHALAGDVPPAGARPTMST